MFTAALTVCLVCLLGSQWSGISLCVISRRSFVLVLTKETFTSNTSFILQSPLMFGQDICFTSNVFSTIRRLILVPGDSNLSLTLAWLPHTFSGCLTYSNENKNWSLNVTLKPDTEFNSSYLCPHCTSSCLTKVNQFHDRSYFMISDNLNWVMLVWNSSQSCWQFWITINVLFGSHQEILLGYNKQHRLTFQTYQQEACAGSQMLNLVCDLKK